MSLNIGVGQRLSLRPVLSQQTIQSLSILQMPTAELQGLISKELLENPTLEASDFDRPEAPTDYEAELQTHAEIQAEKPIPESDSGAGMDEIVEFLQKNTDIDEGVRASNRVSKGAGEEDAKQEVFNQIADVGEDLHDHLMAQLRERECDDLDIPLLEAIVFSLDHRGYLEYPLQDIIVTLQGRYTLEEAEWALSVIRMLDPIGVGALDLADCLLLQIGEQDPDYPLLKRLLTEFWEDVLKNRVPDIARKLKITKEEVKTLISLLGTLNPHPGSAFSHSRAPAITPDVIIDYDDEDNLRVRLTREHVPRLNISPTYLKLLQDNAGDKEALGFIRNKVRNAQTLIDAIDQRQSTLEKVSRRIVSRQPEFIRDGLSGLKPMKMQEIADEIGVHHSTVWRTVNQKYMQTEHGVFEMNDLFTGGLQSGDGDMSREAVKIKVQEIVDNEDKRKPLSDLAIGKALDEFDIKASRRVVTKYRKELGIPDSRVRKQH
jgi:RNA polymerase sigma-54 factor